jgi:hypothetical protein
VLKDELLPALEYAAYAAGWRYAPGLLSWVERAGHRARNRRLGVHRLGGFVGAEPVSIRVVAWDDALRNDLATRFSRHVQGLSLAHEGSLHARELAVSLRDGADIAFVEVPHFRSAPFADAGFFVVPKRVAHVERLDRPDPPLVQRIRRSMEQRGMRAAPTRDPRALAAFARRIYRPFVEHRHGPRARPTPLLVLELVLLRGTLVEIVEGGETVGGALVAESLFDPDGAEIVVIGARDGADEVARTAPVVAARDFARARGKLRCDHLGSAPFLRDGVFRRKERYGTIPRDMSHRQDRIVAFVSDTPGARALVEAEPFLVLDGDALVDVRRRTKAGA